MKTRLYYDAGSQLYFEPLTRHTPAIGVGDTVDLPDGRYSVTKRIVSRAAFRKDRRTKRTGGERLLEIVAREYGGAIEKVTTFIRVADDLSKGGLIKPSDTEEFDDLVYLKLELMKNQTPKIERAVTAGIQFMTTGEMPMPRRDRQRTALDDTEIVLTPASLK